MKISVENYRFRMLRLFELWIDVYKSFSMRRMIQQRFDLINETISMFSFISSTSDTGSHFYDNIAGDADLIISSLVINQS